MGYPRNLYLNRSWFHCKIKYIINGDHSGVQTCIPYCARDSQPMLGHVSLRPIQWSVVPWDVLIHTLERVRYLIMYAQSYCGAYSYCGINWGQPIEGKGIHGKWLDFQICGPHCVGPLLSLHAPWASIIISFTPSLFTLVRLINDLKLPSQPWCVHIGIVTNEKVANDPSMKFY